MGIVINNTEALFIQASQSYETGSYFISEQFSKQIIKETNNIMVLANQADAQITITEEVLNSKTGSINQKSIDSVNSLLNEAKMNYDKGKYTSANTKAFEAYIIIQNAKPINTRFQNYLIKGFGIALVVVIGLFYLRNMENKVKNSWVLYRNS